MKKLLLLLSAVLVFSSAMIAQRTVNGTVMDEAGEPLIGASVLVKENPTVGTFTDLEGKFSLRVGADAMILVVTYIGYTPQEITLGVEDNYNITLLAGIQLEDVVVTSLGIARERKSLGYSVQQVGGDEINRVATPSLQNAISGKFAGVELRQSSGMPGAPTQIFIRGARSFSGDNTPLYVVDGLPIVSTNDYGSNVTGSQFTNRALDIDPNDIESINVLKGQAAAALYGMRASNGVIIITTKKGSNEKSQRPVFSFSSGYTIDNIAKLPGYQTEYAQGTFGAFAPGNSFSFGPKISDLPDDPNYGGNNHGQPGMFFDPYKGQWVTPTGYNNPELFFANNGQTFNNSFNISQSTHNFNYSFGLGATNQEGLIRTSSMDRYSARFAGEFRTSEKWAVGVTGNYAQTDIGKLPTGNDSWLFGVYGAPPSFDLTGTPSSVDGDFGPYRQISYRGGVGRNINWTLDNNKYQEATNRFFGNAYVEFKPIKNLSFKYQLGTDSYTTDNYEYIEMGNSNQISSAAQLPNPANPERYAFVAPTGGSIANYGVTRTTLNSLFTANYSQNITDDISLNILAGNELDHNTSEFYSATGTTFTTPGWANLANATTQFSGYDSYARRTVGFFGAADISYQSLLFLNLTARNDIVSSMPRDNRSFFYPSASLSFVFTELDALANNPVLSFGKIRVSYAEVGQAAGTFLANPPIVTGGAGSGFLSYGITYPFNGVTGYKPSRTLYDPNLIPQNTRTTEFGLDLAFFNDRIGIDYTFYNAISTDQIFGVPMAGSTGYGIYVTNAGKMTGVGHEVVFRVTPVAMSDFQWNFSANFSKLVNEVVELAEGVENISLGGYVTPNIRASAGDTYPAIYGEQFQKDDQGRILVDENPNSLFYGMPMTGGFGKIGDVSPDFILSATNSFTFFKNITLFGQIEWKQGGQMYSGSTRLMGLYGTLSDTEDRTSTFIYDGYLSDGTPNNIVRGGEDDPFARERLYRQVLTNIGEAYIIGTSFVKLRELGLSVNVPNNLIRKVGVSKASVSLVARNIVLWSELPHFDPEASQGQGNMTAGMDYMSMPQTTSYGVTLNLTF